MKASSGKQDNHAENQTRRARHERRRKRRCEGHPGKLRCMLDLLLVGKHGHGAEHGRKDEVKKCVTNKAPTGRGDNPLAVGAGSTGSGLFPVAVGAGSTAETAIEDGRRQRRRSEAKKPLAVGAGSPDDKVEDRREVPEEASKEGKEEPKGAGKNSVPIAVGNDAPKHIDAKEEMRQRSRAHKTTEVKAGSPGSELRSKACRTCFPVAVGAGSHDANARGNSDVPKEASKGVSKTSYPVAVGAGSRIYPIAVGAGICKKSISREPVAVGSGSHIHPVAFGAGSQRCGTDDLEIVAEKVKRGR